MEKKSRRGHVEGVMEGIWRQKRPGGTQEPSGSIQEAPRRFPGSPQEAARAGQRRPEAFRRHTGTPRRQPEDQRSL